MSTGLGSLMNDYMVKKNRLEEVASAHEEVHARSKRVQNDLFEIAAEKRLVAIVKQLEWCEFECEAGPLRLNTSFIELKKMSEIKEE